MMRRLAAAVIFNNTQPFKRQRTAKPEEGLPEQVHMSSLRLKVSGLDRRVAPRPTEAISVWTKWSIPNT